MYASTTDTHVWSSHVNCYCLPAFKLDDSIMHSMQSTVLDKMLCACHCHMQCITRQFEVQLHVHPGQQSYISENHMQVWITCNCRWCSASERVFAPCKALTRTRKSCTDFTAVVFSAVAVCIATDFYAICFQFARLPLLG